MALCPQQVHLRCNRLPLKALALTWREFGCWREGDSLSNSVLAVHSPTRGHPFCGLEVPRESQAAQLCGLEAGASRGRQWGFLCFEKVEGLWPLGRRAFFELTTTDSVHDFLIGNSVATFAEKS